MACVILALLMEDRMVCQEMLRVILEEPDLVVEKVIPQNSIKNLQGRSAVLDARILQMSVDKVKELESLVVA